MTRIAYYFTPVSPWTYLGHERFLHIASAAKAEIEVLPVDFGTIFPASGGLPVAKRAPQRQAYRLVELRRFSEQLKLPLNLHPKHFPVDALAASLLITCTVGEAGKPAAMRLTGALLKAVWAEERNLADAATLAQILAECGLPAALLEASREPAVLQQYQANTQRALEANVFGAPSYVVGGEIFWGQDRLELLRRRLSAD